MVLPLIFLTNCVKSFNERVAWAFRGLYIAKLAGDAVDNSLAAYQKAETQRCLKAHGTKTQGYADCIAKSLEVTRKWTGCKKAEKKLCAGGVALNLQEVQKTTKNALDLALKVGKGDVTGALKKVVCLLASFLKVAKDAKVDFKEYQEHIDALIGLSAGLCQ
jgi:hypothetical protein